MFLSFAVSGQKERQCDVRVVWRPFRLSQVAAQPPEEETRTPIQTEEENPVRGNYF